MWYNLERQPRICLERLRQTKITMPPVPIIMRDEQWTAPCVWLLLPQSEVEAVKTTYSVNPTQYSTSQARTKQHTNHNGNYIWRSEHTNRTEQDGSAL